MREHASFLEPFKRPEDKAEVLKTAHKRLINAAADRVALSMQAPPAATRVEQALTGDAILDEPEDTPAVWGKGDQVLWARGEGLMIASHQGCGKTTLAQQLSLRLIGVDTSPFLGLPVEDDGRQVLYLAMDRPRQALRSMRRMVSKADTNVLRERLHIWRGPLPINVLGTQNALADWVSERYPDVGAVVVDSVKDLAPGVSEDAVGSGLNMSWQALIARGVDLLLLHHQRKAGNGAKRHHTLDDIYGSTWLTSGLGSVVALAGEPGAAVQELRHLKQPASPVELTLRHDHVRGRSEIHDGESEPIDLLREAGPGPDRPTASAASRNVGQHRARASERAGGRRPRHSRRKQGLGRRQEAPGHLPDQGGGSGSHLGLPKAVKAQFRGGKPRSKPKSTALGRSPSQA